MENAKQTPRREAGREEGKEATIPPHHSHLLKVLREEGQERKLERPRRKGCTTTRKEGRETHHPYLLEVLGEEGQVVLGEPRALVNEAGVENVEGQVVLLLLGVGRVGGQGEG